MKLPLFKCQKQDLADKYEKALKRKMHTEKGVTAITKALGYNEDFDWDKAWDWFESPKRTPAQTKRILNKIGVRFQIYGHNY